MPPKKKKISIVKIPLGYEQTFKSPNFQPCPRLFMELLENKAKIKPELRDIEFESKISINGFDNVPTTEEARKQEAILIEKESQPHQEQQEQPQQPQQPQQNSPIQQDQQIFKFNSSPINKSKSLSPESNKYNFLKYSNRSNLNNDVSNSPEKKPSFTNEDSSFNKTTSPHFQNKKPSFIIDNEEVIFNKKPSFIIDDKEEVLFNKKPSFINEDNEDLSYKQNNYNEPVIDKEDEEINKLMRGNVDEKPYQQPQQQPQYQQPQQQQQKQQQQIPTLEEISKNQVPLKYNIPTDGNIANMSYIGTEKDITKKRDLLYKFKTLKKSYKDVNIPEVNEFMDLRDIEREYDTIVKQIRIDSNVENYKKFLIIGFFGLEFLLTTFLKFDDVKGFAQQQMVGINQYEKILIEIGEKHQISPSEQWSPELRLAGLVFMNAAIFIGTKMLFKATGDNILGMLNSATSSSSSSSSSSSHNDQPKRKMRGPDIDLDDLDSKKRN